MTAAVNTTTYLTHRMEEQGLSFMAANLESFLSDQSRKEQTLMDALFALLDIEYCARKERNACTRLKLSGMPQTKTLKQFDLSWLKGGPTQDWLEELKWLAYSVPLFVQTIYNERGEDRWQNSNDGQRTEKQRSLCRSFVGQRSM